MAAAVTPDYLVGSTGAARLGVFIPPVCLQNAEPWFGFKLRMFLLYYGIWPYFWLY
jgi:hypothetical protein